MLMTEEAPSGVASITVNDEGESDRVVTLVYLSGIVVRYSCQVYLSGIFVRYICQVHVPRN